MPPFPFPLLIVVRLTARAMSLLPLLAQATVETAAAVPHAHSPGLPEQFGLELGYVIWQLVSFTILALVLYRFAIKPILAISTERNRKIEEGLRNADATRHQLAAAQAEAAQLVKASQLEASKIIDEARKTAKEFADRQQADAIAQANQTLEKAKQAIALEHKKMLADARQEIARLVVATTQRVLATELTDSDRARYNAAASRELTHV